MMEEVDDELVKCPSVFDLLTTASQKPLYPRCTKFTKLTIVLTISTLRQSSIRVTSGKKTLFAAVFWPYYAAVSGPSISDSSR